MKAKILDLRKSVDWITRKRVEECLVHFLHKDTKHDVWVKMDTAHISAPGSHTFKTGNELKVGHIVEVFDDHPKSLEWVEGRIVHIDGDSVLVSYVVSIAYMHIIQGELNLR